MILPSGVVTFLFTDIEGSTRLWDQYPDAMREALSRHDQILAQEIAARGGHIFKRLGDGLCAVFPNARDAAESALAAQRAANAATWPEARRLRIRIALLTGIADQRDGDYFGTAVNRTSRLLDAAHGGQILASSTTYDLIRDQLPAGATAIDLGPHRLKDLQVEEHVIQLTPAGVASDFPPIRSLARSTHNLPSQLTSFVGRQREMEEVAALLSNCRLLTLTGAGGCGKTRLATQVAASQGARFPNGIWLVELASMNKPSHIPQSIAATMHLHDATGETAAATLLDRLRDKNLLLILDNCEHLVADVATLADQLLRSSRLIRILATSREPLGIAGETTWRVPSLALPPTLDKRALEEDPEHHLSTFEATRLFVERAAAASNDFRVTAQNARAIHEICRRLDGIPLAIELAAARVRVQTPEQIAVRLDDRFGLLRGGTCSALPRHQTLKALIDWSFDLLEPVEQAMLARLSVFNEGFLLEMAESVSAQPPISPPDVLDALMQLVQKSLLIVDDSEDPPRYRMLETVRQYARQKLIEQGEAGAMGARHAEVCRSIASRIEAGMRTPQPAEWLARLRQDHENLLAAIAWSASHGDDETALGIAGDLAMAWHTLGRRTEGRGAIERLLTADLAGVSARVRAQALHGAGILAWGQKDHDAARIRLQDSGPFWEQCGDRRGLASSLSSLAMVAIDTGAFQEAHALLERSLAIREEIGDSAGMAACLSNMGMAAVYQGKLDSARRLYEQSLDRRRALRDGIGIANSLNNLGDVCFRLGEFTESRKLYQEALTIFEALGDHAGIAQTQSNLAEAAVRLAETATARPLFQKARDAFQAVGNRRGLAVTEIGLADVALNEGDYAAAARGFACAIRICRTLSDPRLLAHALAGQAKAAAGLAQPRDGARFLAAAEAAAPCGDASPAADRAYRLSAEQTVRRALGESKFEVEMAVARETAPESLVNEAAEFAVPRG